MEMSHTSLNSFKLTMAKLKEAARPLCLMSFELSCRAATVIKGCISTIYDLFTTLTHKLPYMIQWEQNMGSNFELEE